jgi:ATP-dependent Clp protease, protease subunit
MTLSKKLAALAFVLVVASLFPLSNIAKTNNDLVVLSKDNMLVLSGEVNGDSVGSLILKAKELNRGYHPTNAPIYLFLNTPGGGIQAGLEFIEAVNGMGRPVNTVTLFAASMGFQIAQNLGDRLVLRNGILMSHRAQGEFSGYFGGQRPSQMDARYGLWLSRITELDEQTVKRTNGKQTLESYQKAYANELWLTGQQAVDGGYADRIVSLRCDSSLDGVTTHQVEFMGITIQYDLDNCPINTSPSNVKIVTKDDRSDISYEKAKEIEAKFLEQYISKQKSVIPMYW